MSKRKTSYTDGASSSKKRPREQPQEGEVEEDITLEDDSEPRSEPSTSNVDDDPPHQAEAGIVEFVGLKNFMCHSRLDFTFNPNVNIINGRNGSGKSAVMSALTVGLGSKASVASRGPSLKTFIKHGKSSAEVVVKLRNGGQDAYKHDVYGDMIIVERILKADGTNPYKMKNKEGKVKSTKRDELVLMLDHFNIQVDNPVAFLNQDTSRNFLHSKDAKDKYKFFLKATQLENVKNDYAQINKEKEKTKSTVGQKEETLPVLENEVLKWDQKYKAVQSIDGLKEKVLHFKEEATWAVISGKEKALEPLKNKLKKEVGRTPMFVREIEKNQAKLDPALKKRVEIQEQLKDVTKKLEDLAPRHTDVKKIKDAKKTDVRRFHNGMRSIDDELKNVKRDRDETNGRIEEIRNSAQNDYEAEKRDREVRIDELEEELNSLKTQQRTVEHDSKTFDAAVQNLKEREYTLRGEKQDAQTKVSEAERRLRTLQASSRDQLSRFGQFMPDLVKKIDDAHRRGQFHKKPKGPIGAHIRLTDDAWALAMEACLGNQLTSFCCHDAHDGKVLDGIMKSVIRSGGRIPNVIISTFDNQHYDVSQHRVRSKYPAVYDLLKIEDPVISNKLIDLRGIECIVMIKDKVEARRLLIENPPANCREAYVPSGDKMFCRPTFRSYASNISRSQYFTKDVKNEIQQCQADLKKYKDELAGLKAENDKVNSDLRKQQDEQRKAQTQLMRINQKIATMNREITDLKNVQDPEPIDVETLMVEVEHYEEQIREISTRRDTMKEKASNVKREYEEAERELKAVEGEQKEISDSADPLKDSLTEIDDEITNIQHAKTHYQKELKDHEKKIAYKTKEVEELEAELTADIANAEKICERVRTRRTVKTIENEINAITKQIEAHEKIHGNKEEILRKADETANSFRRVVRDISNLKRFLQLLGKVMDQRQTAYFDFRKTNALRAKLSFIVMLDNRNYIGSMNFDHENEKLTLTVQPSQKEGEGAKDMKALSGGERSFSTVCFILALWDAMESPFRCLDEFDVFMDMVNRRISMDMMLDIANTQLNRQFIFLTPLDMSKHEMKSIVTIYRMPDPDRGQGVLPFGENEEENGDNI